MTIADNTTTSLELDFSEAVLTAGEDISRLFRQQVPAASTDFQGQLGVGAYGRRLVWWGGDPFVGTPFEGSLARWSGADEPEFYDNVFGLMNVSENDGYSIRAGFELNERWYWVKDKGIHSTRDDGINEPSRWEVKEEDPAIGTPSVHGVGDGGTWKVIADRSGLYYYEGGKGIKISQEIQPTWDSINWLYGHLIWVKVDTQKKRVYLGAPFCTGTTPNLLLVLDYQEGILVDPIANHGQGRKWCPWFIKPGHGDFIRRAALEERFVLGLSVGNGKVHEIPNSETDDDGAAINSYYRTAYISRKEMGRQLFGYFTALVRGAGSLTVGTFRQGGTGVTWNSITLESPALKDVEKTIDVQSERMSLKVGTSVVGSWFSIAKVCIWSKEHPWAKHRGANV